MSNSHSFVLPLMLAVVGACGSVASTVRTTDAGITNRDTGSSTAGCHTSADCPASDTTDGIPAGCLQPGAIPGCICEGTESCSTDADCGDSLVCSTDPKYGTCGSGAGSGAGTCISACAGDTDCEGWERCETNGDCVTRSCAQCPTYLSCTANACGPKSCAKDGDCPGGYCVGGECFGELGYCQGACE